ncbi:MAG: Hsp33 family molecular chaperone HslO [Verrucomicrobia bacterium]|nr:Hsp33 family molecular chaperone HslO [Verrucomicrobiota bacterium]
MSGENPPAPADAGFEVRTSFVRSRNVLLARADFGELYVDYYLHLGANGLKVAPELDALFKRALAAFGLHCATRPWNEMIAWTFNFQEPRVNLFLTGDNSTGGVTGRVFTENVREGAENLFYADVVRGSQPKRRSAITFTGADPLVAVEQFYAQSEQRGARFFQLAEEEFALVTEHPDCDLTWYRGLDVAQILALAQTETVVPLERRVQRWHCGCNQPRLMQVLLPAMKEDPAGLFGDAEKIEVRCPRCGARHVITREALEAFAAGRK